MKFSFRLSQIGPLIFAALAAWGSPVAPARAAVWYFNIPAASGNADIDTLTAWSANADGSGGNPTAFSASDTYYSNKGGTRFLFSNETFVGTFVLGTTATDILTLKPSGSTQINTLANLVSQGGGAIADALQASTVNPTLRITRFENDGTTYLNSSAPNGGRIMSLVIGTLLGSGNLALENGGAAANNIGLSIQDATAFTGNIVWSGASNTSLQFDAGFVSGGGLIDTNNTARINLNGQSVTFASLTLGGTALAAGTYTESWLQANYSTIFSLDSGTGGSLTVAPEPSAAALFLGAASLAAVAVGRRRPLA